MWKTWEMCEWNSEGEGHKEAQRWMENQIKRQRKMIEGEVEGWRECAVRCEGENSGTLLL